MDFGLFEMFNSFEEKNQDILLTFFTTIGISLVAYLIPAGWGKFDITQKRFALAKLTNEAFPRAIVGGVSFYVALIFLIRSSDNDFLFRGMIVLILLTIFCWLFSIFLTLNNEKVIEKKEEEYLRKKTMNLPVEFSVWRMVKWNLLIVSVWLTMCIGLCLSKPLNSALIKNSTKQAQIQKPQE
jgi:uncharacterized protein with PQ loop repeat